MLLVLALRVQVAAFARGFERQVVHGEVHVALHLVHVGVVVRLLVVAAAARVAARLDLALAGDVGARLAVDDHVRQVDGDDVLGRELLLEFLQREEPALVDELADARDRVVLLDVEGQHRIGHRAVRHLFVDAEHVAAPVAARRHRALGVDRHLGAAAGALEGPQHGCVGRDVARARGDDRALELVDVLRRSRTAPRRARRATRCGRTRRSSRSVPGLCRMSVAPHFGQWLRPSLSSLADVSMATGSGFSSSSRIGGGSVAGSTPSSPGRGGTSCGDPGPVNFGGLARRSTWPCVYRPSALAFSAS